MIINNFKPYSGIHCETTTIGNLLLNKGINIAEPFLFGLGEGLGYRYFGCEEARSFFPLLSGRIAPGEIIKNLGNNLGFILEVNENESPTKAMEKAKEVLARAEPLGLRVNCYYLDYFTKKMHFSAHYITIYGYDDTCAYIADTAAQGTEVKITLKDLMKARNSKLGFSPARNLSLTIKVDKDLPPFEQLIPPALKRTACAYLEDKHPMGGHRGLLRTADQIEVWFSKLQNPALGLKLSAIFMEKGGTGGANFRNLYCDFLNQSLDYISSPNLQKSAAIFRAIAGTWTELSSLLQNSSENYKLNNLKEASKMILSLADSEKEAMQLLSAVEG